MNELADVLVSMGVIDAEEAARQMAVELANEMRLFQLYDPEDAIAIAMLWVAEVATPKRIKNQAELMLKAVYKLGV